MAVKARSGHIWPVLRYSMSNKDAPIRGAVSQQLHGLGCAAALAVVNLVVMGLITYTFARMSYPNIEQERWYRGGSLAFLILGAIFPICWLVLIRRGRWGSIKAIFAWMFAALLAFMGYVLMSGGGI
jgi:hypothetical protein